MLRLPPKTSPKQVYDRAMGLPAGDEAPASTQIFLEFRAIPPGDLREGLSDFTAGATVPVVRTPAPSEGSNCEVEDLIDIHPKVPSADSPRHHRRATVLGAWRLIGTPADRKVGGRSCVFRRRSALRPPRIEAAHGEAGSADHRRERRLRSRRNEARAPRAPARADWLAPDDPGEAAASRTDPSRRDDRHRHLGRDHRQERRRLRVDVAAGLERVAA